MKITEKEIRDIVRSEIELNEGFWDIKDSPILQGLGIVNKDEKEGSAILTNRDGNLKLAEYTIELQMQISDIVTDHCLLNNPVIMQDASGYEIRYNNTLADLPEELKSVYDEEMLKVAKKEYREELILKHFSQYDLDKDKMIGDQGDFEIAAIDYIRNNVTLESIYAGIKDILTKKRLIVQSKDKKTIDEISNNIAKHFDFNNSDMTLSGDYILDAQDNLVFKKHYAVILPPVNPIYTFKDTYAGSWRHDVRNIINEYENNNSNVYLLGVSIEFVVESPDLITSEYEFDASVVNREYENEIARLERNRAAQGDITPIKTKEVYSQIYQKFKPKRSIFDEEKPFPYKFSASKISYIYDTLNNVDVDTINSFGGKQSIITKTFRIASATSGEGDTKNISITNLSNNLNQTSVTQQKKEPASLSNKMSGLIVQQLLYLTKEAFIKTIDNVTKKYEQQLSEIFKNISKYNNTYGWYWYNDETLPRFDAQYSWTGYDERDIEKIELLTSQAIYFLNEIKKEITKNIQYYYSDSHKHNKNYKLDWLNVDHLEGVNTHPNIQEFGPTNFFVTARDWQKMKSIYEAAMGTFLWKVLPIRHGTNLKKGYAPHIKISQVITSLNDWNVTMKGIILQNKRDALADSGLNQNMINQFTGSVKKLKEDIKAYVDICVSTGKISQNSIDASNIRIITDASFRVNKEVQAKMKQIKKYLKKGFIDKKFAAEESELFELAKEAISLRDAISKDDPLVVTENRRITLSNLRKIIRNTLL